MKYKTQENPIQEKVQEKKGMDKSLYEMFVDLIQFEINKLSFITSAKTYFFQHGFLNYKKFFKAMYCECEELKGCLVGYLIEQMEEVPEFKIPAIDTDFENHLEPFEILRDLEDRYVNTINAIALKALEVKDMHTLAYMLPKIAEVKHIACIALEAVKNEQDPLDLLECE